MCAQKLQILAIIGQGYVGLPLAMAAVDAGWSVIGVDNFEAKVTQMMKKLLSKAAAIISAKEGVRLANELHIQIIGGAQKVNYFSIFILTP